MHTSIGTAQRIQKGAWKGRVSSVWRTFFALSLCALSGCSLIFGRDYVKYIQYPLAPGDTLYKLSQKYNVSLNELYAANRVGDVRELQVGQIILIPYRGQSLERGSSYASTSSKASSSAPSSTPKEKIAKNEKSLSQVRLSSAKKYVGALTWPVSGGGVSSRFGWRWLSFHEGIDITKRIGVDIRAAHSGQVVYSGSGLRGYGNIVIVKGDSIVTVYAHNRRNFVRVGQRVSRGQKIAELGQSGKSTGPHLHFETRIKGANGKNVAVDPLAFY